MFFYNKKAFTLNEVMLAVVIIAVTFIPIVGVLTSSFKTTEKDDHIIKAMQLCQEKLGTAVQFPFSHFDAGTYNTTQTTTGDPNDPNNKPLTLILGPETDAFLSRVNFSSTLVVEEPAMSFNNVPVFDFTQLGDAPNYTTACPAECVTRVSRDITHMVKRYTVTVTWNEKETNATTGNSRFYTLSTLKVDVRR